MDTREAVKARKEMESRIYQFIFDEMLKFKDASGIHVENIKVEFARAHVVDGSIIRFLDYVEVICRV